MAGPDSGWERTSAVGSSEEKPTPSPGKRSQSRRACHLPPAPASIRHEPDLVHDEELAVPHIVKHDPVVGLPVETAHALGESSESAHFELQRVRE